MSSELAENRRRSARGQAAERLRALPVPLGGGQHGGRAAHRRALPGVSAALRGLEFGEGSHINIPIAVLIWLMIYPMMLKIDFAVDPRRRQAAPRPPRHALRELAGQAVLDGVPRLALLPARLLALDRAGAGRPVHRRRHHPRRRALHGDGLRLVVPLGRRSRLHARAGVGERPHHAGRLRADREAAGAGRGRPRSAVRVLLYRSSSSSSSRWPRARRAGRPRRAPRREWFEERFLQRSRP